MKAIIVLTAVTLMLAGCATAQRMNKVSLGMSKADVAAVLGAPNSVSATTGVEYMNYAFYETNEDGKWGRSTPYFVRIVNGRVDAYGRQGDFNSTRPPERTVNLNVKTTETER